MSSLFLYFICIFMTPIYKVFFELKDSTPVRVMIFHINENLSYGCSQATMRSTTSLTIYDRITGPGMLLTDALNCPGALFTSYINK